MWKMSLVYPLVNLSFCCRLSWSWLELLPLRTSRMGLLTSCLRTLTSPPFFRWPKKSLLVRSWQVYWRGQKRWQLETVLTSWTYYYRSVRNVWFLSYFHNVSHTTLSFQCATKKRPSQPPSLLGKDPKSEENTKLKGMLAEQLAKVLLKKNMGGISEYALHCLGNQC